MTNTETKPLSPAQQLAAAGFKVVFDEGHNHIFVNLTGRPKRLQVAVYRAKTMNAPFAGWGWVATPNGRTDVRDWDEFLAALATHTGVTA